MLTPEMNELVRRAEEIYYGRLQRLLESEHKDEFVAIEPESGEYFLGRTLSEATKAARQVYPDRPTHVMRVGHKAALHFGVHSK